jgi:hypothetical protein
MPTLGGVHAHLTLQVEPGAHRLRDRFEDLGQISADLPLHEDRRDEDSHVHDLDAVSEAQQGFLEGKPELLLLERDPELGGQRLRGFIGRHAQARGERMPRPHRTGDQIDGVGKLALQLQDAPPLLPADVEVGADRRRARRRCARAWASLNHERRRGPE